MVQDEPQYKIVNTAQIEPGSKSGDVEQAWLQSLQTQAITKHFGKTGGYGDPFFSQ